MKGAVSSTDEERTESAAQDGTQEQRLSAYGEEEKNEMR